MKVSKYSSWACLGLITTLAMACGDDAPKPAKKPAGRDQAKAGLNVLTKGSAGATGGAAKKAADQPAGGNPKTVEADESEVAYVYSPIGKRDPFRSLFDIGKDTGGNESLTELQKFEIDQLKLVAIVSRIATPYAMVEDPNGKGHTLTRGKLLGKNWGRVAQITPECVVVKEEYRDYTGRKVTNKTSLCLPKPSELKID